MMEQNNTATDHVIKISEELSALVEHLRKDIKIVDDAKAKALFETSAEVILGLKKAFHDYIEKKEPAWK